jgi:quercetin dioxygenase-like cupin family protein
MYFKYDEKNGIHVPEPFKRVMTPLMTSDLVDRELPFSVHFTEWEPGRRIDSHSHPDAMEAMYCLSGNAHAKIDGEWVEFVPGTMIVADKNEEHCIVNDGDELLRVFCIFSPPVSGEGLRKRAMAAVKEAKENK